MKFSLIIPVFNEEESLFSFHEKLKDVMNQIALAYEIIYVDDASSDGSLQILKELASQEAFTKIISFKEKRGQSSALYAGFKICQGQWIITLDADNQNPPEEIKNLWEFCKKFDYVVGIRKKRRDPFLKKKASALAKLSRRLILKDVTSDTGCSLRIFRREILQATPFFNNFHRFFTFLVRAKGFSVKEVPVAHRQRQFGQSKYGLFRRFRQGLFDLWGVYWLKKRLINYEVKYQG